MKKIKPEQTLRIIEAKIKKSILETRELETLKKVYKEVIRNGSHDRASILHYLATEISKITGVNSQKEAQDKIQEDTMSMEEKININVLGEHLDELVHLAKSVGRYFNSEPGTTERTVSYQSLQYDYEAFCEWRHEEPYRGTAMSKIIKKLISDML